MRWHPAANFVINDHPRVQSIAQPLRKLLEKAKKSIDVIDFTKQSKRVSDTFLSANFAINWLPLMLSRSTEAGRGAGRSTAGGRGCRQPATTPSPPRATPSASATRSGPRGRGQPRQRPSPPSCPSQPQPPPPGLGWTASWKVSFPPPLTKFKLKLWNSVYTTSVAKVFSFMCSLCSEVVLP